MFFEESLPIDDEGCGFIFIYWSNRKLGGWFDDNEMIYDRFSELYTL